MSKYYESGEKFFWGVKWTQTLEESSLNTSLEIGFVDTGCPVEVLFNKEFGKIAFVHLAPKDLIIEAGHYENLLEKIRKKSLENKPYIIFADIKSKQICEEWNGHSNTVCSKDDFEQSVKENM